MEGRCEQRKIEILGESEMVRQRTILNCLAEIVNNSLPRCRNHDNHTF